MFFQKNILFSLTLNRTIFLKKYHVIFFLTRFRLLKLLHGTGYVYGWLHPA